MGAGICILESFSGVQQFTVALFGFQKQKDTVSVRYRLKSYR
jgi:hypothetical protein